MQKGNAHFELHFKSIGGYEGQTGEMVEAYWRGLCEEAVIVNDGFSSYRIPSSFHHGFILLLHLQSHLLAEGVGLRHLCDWALFVNSFSNQAFQDIFETKLKKIGLWRLAQVLSLVAVVYMGMPYQVWMGDDKDAAEALLRDILYGGNFGRKDSQRAYEGLFISDKKNSRTSKKRISHVFSSLNRIVDIHWKIAKKIPIIYPLGWIFFSLRFLWRVLIGKRQMNLVDTYQKSGERKTLYDRLNIFEPESQERQR